MDVHKNCKSYLALTGLLVSLLFSIVALATHNWFETKTDDKEGTTSTTVLGLWIFCFSLDAPTFNVSKCFKVSQGVDFANVVGSDVYFEANFPSQRRKRQTSSDQTGKITLAQFQAIVNNKIYPGYLKAMQAFEISAVILTVISVVAWLGIVVMSALAQKRKSMILVLYIVVVAFGLLTATAHLLSTIIWIVEKENEKSQYLPKDLKGITLSYGWSFAMAIAAAVLQFIAVILVILTKSVDKPQ